MEDAHRFAKRLSLAHCHAPARPLREQDHRPGPMRAAPGSEHRLWFLRSGVVTTGGSELRAPASWVQRAGEDGEVCVSQPARIAQARFTALLPGRIDALADLAGPLRLAHGRRDGAVIGEAWDSALREAAATSAGDPWARARLRGAFVLLLAETIAAGFRFAGWRLTASGDPPWLSAVLACCRARLGDTQLDVEALASTAGLSASRFAHAFRTALGESPMRHLLSLRLELAGTVLRTTGRSIKEVAAACGFRDADHFTSRFRASTGLTPTAWRQQQKGR